MRMDGSLVAHAISTNLRANRWKPRYLRWRTHPRKHASRPAKLAKKTWLSLQFLCRRQWEHSCVPRRHFPQTSAQIVGNKGQPEAEVCGARDVPEGTVSCSWRRLWMPGTHGVGTSADTARKSVPIAFGTRIVMKDTFSWPTSPGAERAFEGACATSTRRDLI